MRERCSQRCSSVCGKGQRQEDKKEERNIEQVKESRDDANNVDEYLLNLVGGPRGCPRYLRPKQLTPKQPSHASTYLSPRVSTRSGGGGGRDGLGLKDGLEEVLDDLVLALLAGGLDLLDLDVGLLVGLVLGGLVSLRVLFRGQGSARKREDRWWVYLRTWASNFLNSSSLDLR